MPQHTSYWTKFFVPYDPTDGIVLRPVDDQLALALVGLGYRLWRAPCEHRVHFNHPGTGEGSGYLHHDREKGRGYLLICAGSRYLYLSVGDRAGHEEDPEDEKGARLDALDFSFLEEDQWPEWVLETLLVCVRTPCR